MDEPVVDQAPEPAEVAVDDVTKEPANGSGESMTNHIDESHRNGNVNGDEKKSHSSSSKHHSSSHKSDGHRSSSSHKSSHSDKQKSSSDKHRSDKHGSDKHGSDKHRSSSSSHKHSSSSDKHKHSSSSGDKHSSSKHSSSDKHKSSSDRHHSSSDKHKSSSSSDKHKSSSSSDKRKSSSSSDKRKSSSLSSKHTSSSDKHNSSIKTETKEKEHSDTETTLVSPKQETNDIDYKLSSSITVDVKKETDESITEMMNSSADFTPAKKVKDELMEEAEQDEEEEHRASPPKRKYAESESEDEYKPKSKSKKVKSEKGKKRKTEEEEYSDFEYSEGEEVKAAPKKKKKTAKKDAKKEAKKAANTSTTSSPQKGKKAKKEEESLTDVWRWWEEEKTDSSIKWKVLEHKGPVFDPDYEPLPDNVKFYYDGKSMKLEPESEEVMTFYGKMLDHDYTTKEAFNDNFFKDWRKTMTLDEKKIITDLTKCNFSEINEYFKMKSEERKNRTKEEKLIEKQKNEELVKQYGTAIVDGYRQKIGNFRIEPPSLFRGRGEHPKMGCLKRRLWPRDVIINCSKGSTLPEAPFGQKWKEVRHDNTVTWLASWTENVQGQTKYVMLNASSRLKGEKDWQKYEMARKLHKCVDKIRASYREDMSSKEMRIRQRSVAMYFIDKLALRAGNEKDEDTADTVGCCTLRVEHITLHKQLADKEHVVEFDFLGKDSMRYQNQVAVDKRAFKNLQLFMSNKQPGDDLFDRLNTSILNQHLTQLMEGLTAKVFRTFNASKTLQDQLDLLTNEDDTQPAKILSYNRANRAVAILCNHQRSVPKGFDTQMENMKTKISAKKAAVKDARGQVKAAKVDAKRSNTPRAKDAVEKKKKALARLEDQLNKLEVQATDKDENKDIALGTSKLNYLDPRISVAWCKKWEVPIEKIYNKTQREKFQWAIDMATADYHF